MPSIAKLDQLEAAYNEAAKKAQKKSASVKDIADFKKAKQAFQDARAEYRIEEQAAGRRSPGLGINT